MATGNGTPDPSSRGANSYQEFGSKSPEPRHAEEANTNWFSQLTAQVRRNLELAHPASGGWERVDITDGVRLFKKSWKDRWPLPEHSSPALYVSLRADKVAKELVCNVVLEDDLALQHRLQIPYDLAKVFLDGPEVTLAKVPLSQKSDLMEPMLNLADKSIFIIEKALQKSVALDLLDSID